MRIKNTQLTDTEKEVLHLIADEFLTIKQIQIRRGCSFQAVYKILKRIKEKLPHFEIHREKNDRHLKIRLEKDKENPKHKVLIFENIEKCYCYFCDHFSDEITQAHHIVPVSKGGKDEPNNILYICPNCHRLIHKKGYELVYSKGYYYIYDKAKGGIYLPSLRVEGDRRLNSNGKIIPEMNNIPSNLFNFKGEVCNEKGVQS